MMDGNVALSSLRVLTCARVCIGGHSEISHQFGVELIGVKKVVEHAAAAGACGSPRALMLLVHLNSSLDADQLSGAAHFLHAWVGRGTRQGGHKTQRREENKEDQT